MLIILPSCLRFTSVAPVIILIIYVISVTLHEFEYDLPQSVQVLTERLIIDLAARDITDLYRSIAGVSEFSYSGVTFRAPEHQVGLWTRYDFEEIGSSIAFGMDYVSEQFSFQGRRVKPYTVFDASWPFRYWSRLPPAHKTLTRCRF